MVRMALWRWPSVILARKASPWLTVARVSVDDAASAREQAHHPVDLPIEPARRDFQDTLPIVFHLGNNVDAEAPGA